MTLRFAERMSRLGTEGAFEVLAQARLLEAQGQSIVHLEIGEPDFASPDNVVESAVEALRAGQTHYTPASGLMEVREAAATYIAQRVGVDAAAENVVLVPGTKNLLHFALLSLIEPGEEVLVPDPGYPIYPSLVQFTGAQPIAYPIRERNDFRVDIEELRSLVTARTRMLIINSPANPTGGVLTLGDLEAIADLAVEHDLWVVSDEIYGRVLYDGQHHSIAALPGMAERTLLIDGMSKAWAMCGWRLGFGVMPVELARRFDTLMINTSSCAATFTQLAAMEALRAPASDAAVAAMVEEFRARRDLVVAGLNAIDGIRCRVPAGAFYAFPNVEQTGLDARALATGLLRQGGVALLPGTAFGLHGAGFLRLSFAASRQHLALALTRIAAHLAAVPAVG